LTNHKAVPVDKRFNKITHQLTEYSLGRFDKRLQLSSRYDEIDAFISGINMLGEELKSITISRNYFTNIFDAVSDMIFILNQKGVIENVNHSALQLLEYPANGLIKKMVNILQIPGSGSFLNELMKQLKYENSSFTQNSVFVSFTGKLIPVEITAKRLEGENINKRLILLMVKDITLQAKTENLIIRAIIDTQEKERRRLAKDLHDSLGQQLSAVKFYISTTAGNEMEQQQKDILLKSNEALTEIIADMRNICFNLMPKTLEEFGLVKAVNEFCNHTRYDNIKFSIKQLTALPPLLKELEIDIFRVIQEFISNSIIHGNAGKISIAFSKLNKVLKVTLKDNGKGFDGQLVSTGMGIQNAYSRVKSHNGIINISSKIGKGTSYVLIIPVNL
jgi:PAS domain S-box-containing protein